MTRVSLREAYDNKDVVAQIYAIRDTAESAEDSAEQAVTTANTASDHVDALVPQVEGAVENANSASASAQASAQTVAGYENRLATAESDINDLETDLNAVTLRVTTAEGQIVTIQGRVTALETADRQNVKLTGEHAIGNYAVLLTGNQDNISGSKTFITPGIFPRKVFIGKSFSNNTTKCVKVLTVTAHSYSALDMLVNVVRQAPVFAKIVMGGNVNQLSCKCFSPITSFQDKVIICHNTDAPTFDIYLASIANQPVNVAFEAYTRYGSEQYGTTEISVSSDITEIEQSELPNLYDSVVYSTGY